MVTPVHADEGNTVTITYTVASSYTFVIPDSFTTAENAEYTVEIGENPIIPYGSQIRIALDHSANGTQAAPFRMKNEKGQYISDQIRKGESEVL